MSSKKMLVILNNEFDFSIDANINQQLDDFFDEYVKIIDFGHSCDELYEKFPDWLYIKTDELNVTMQNLYDDKYTMYCVYYVDGELCKSFDGQQNKFGSCIVNEIAVGNMIITKHNIVYDKNEVAINLDSISSIDEVKLIIKNTIIKSGLIVNASTSEMTQYNYVTTPFDLIIRNSKSTDEYTSAYRYHDFELYDRVIQLIVKIKDYGTSINEFASFLCGRIVYGDVFIAMYKKPMYNEHPPFVSIDCSLLTKIVELRKHSQEAGLGIVPNPDKYINFEYMLDDDINKFKHENELLLSDLNQNEINKQNNS